VKVERKVAEMRGAQRWLAKVAFRALALATGACALLVLVDVAHQQWWRTANYDLRRARVGLYELDPVLGYRPRPGFVGAYPEGVEGEGGRPRRIAINELGHREGPPGPVDTLLIGDSFVFGALLDQDDTIAAQATRMGGRRFYGAGAPGYDTAQILETLRRAVGPTRPAHVVYAFYENDLLHRERAYRIDAGGHLEVFENGQWPDPPAPPPFVARSSLRIEGLRGLRLQGHFAPHASAPMVAKTVEATLAMQRVAADCGATFSVFVLPTVIETVTGEPMWAIQAYVGALHRNGVRVLTCDLSRGDFFRVDQHVNARGAEKIARALIESRAPTRWAAR
jgi:hypothetical protein